MTMVGWQASSVRLERMARELYQQQGGKQAAYDSSVWRVRYIIGRVAGWQARIVKIERVARVLWQQQGGKVAKQATYDSSVEELHSLW